MSGLLLALLVGAVCYLVGYGRGWSAARTACAEAREMERAAVRRVRLMTCYGAEVRPPTFTASRN